MLKTRVSVKRHWLTKCPRRVSLVENSTIVTSSRDNLKYISIQSVLCWQIGFPGAVRMRTTARTTTSDIWSTVTFHVVEIQRVANIGARRAQSVPKQFCGGQWCRVQWHVVAHPDGPAEARRQKVQLHENPYSRSTFGHA